MKFKLSYQLEFLEFIRRQFEEVAIGIFEIISWKSVENLIILIFLTNNLDLFGVINWSCYEDFSWNYLWLSDGIVMGLLIGKFVK